MALVERDGSVRSFHVADVTAQTLRPIIVTQVNRASYLMTNESRVYTGISPRVCPARHREPFRRGICPRHVLAHQHG